MVENESEKKDEFHFIQLVITFQTAAIQQMGKLQNPITKNVERNLDQAKFSIDMLEMIQSKTRNNLSENERKFLEHALYELRMNYLDEVKKEEQKEKEKDFAQEDQSGSGESKEKKGEHQQETRDSSQTKEGKDQSTSGD
ncbi:MAG: DUF1844 domain-containing protein [candidate division Zixibacteria bacterium]|nr:DUF1844 domain-containing protein [candidate division Zixibacteria bacterium]